MSHIPIPYNTVVLPPIESDQKYLETDSAMKEDSKVK